MPTSSFDKEIILTEKDVNKLIEIYEAHKSNKEKTMICEKCWSDAFNRAYTTGKSQSECYQDLLIERKDNPCSPKEQAGTYWDEENQWDIRTKIKSK